MKAQEMTNEQLLEQFSFFWHEYGKGSNVTIPDGNGLRAELLRRLSASSQGPRCPKCGCESFTVHSANSMCARVTCKYDGWTSEFFPAPTKGKE